MNNRFIKFIFVGILNTIVGYGSYGILIYFDVNYLISNTISTIVGILNSYILNRRITFNDTKTTKSTPFKFLLVYFISYSLGMINLSLLVNYFMINPYIAGAINLILTTSVSWFGHKYFSFK